eukprot:4956951-Lingulodinium_polyedra.AAC.1
MSRFFLRSSSDCSRCTGPTRRFPCKTMSSWGWQSSRRHSGRAPCHNKTYPVTCARANPGAEVAT